MKTFTPKTFKIPTLKGISAKTIAEHIKLYEGYVKNANSILEKTPEYSKLAEKDPFVPYFTGELRRRFSFEYNGMRNHEVYFSSLEGGSKALDEKSPLRKAIEEDCGKTLDEFLMGFKAAASSIRGIGWMVLWYDRRDKRLLASWVDEQHFGELNDCAMILAIDMWEHSYVADYQPSGKKQYVEDFFANLNWEVVEENYERARG
jgi:Fe-Mn family superoxide dismutase